MMKRCENGHYYESDKHSSCPYCGVPIDDLPATDRKRDPGGRPQTARDVEPPTAPRRQPAAPEPQPPPRAAPAPGVDRGADGVTVAYWGKRGFDPVVGWL
ncbi:MAG: hypothetical protein GY856_49515, partial [bacterium]|nr:hypothetical protein [bacterium]